MSYDPYLDALLPAAEAKLDPLMQQQVAEDLKRFELEEQTRKHFQRLNEQRYRDWLKTSSKRHKEKQSAKSTLKIPNVLRRLIGGGQNDWQLHQKAAGFDSAPATPPIDWDRMTVKERADYRNQWKSHPPRI